GPLAAVVFRAEESSVYGQAYLGSKAMLNGLSEDELGLVARTGENEGMLLEEALEKAGIEAERTREASLPLDRINEFFEAHIEQGPVLEEEGKQIGIPTSIRGNQRYILSIEGEEGHSGTYPMWSRRDALRYFIESGIGKKLYEIADKHQREATATIGAVEVMNGSVNKVPGSVKVYLEIRADSNELRERLHERFVREIFGDMYAEKQEGDRRIYETTVTIINDASVQSPEPKKLKVTLEAMKPTESIEIAREGVERLIETAENMKIAYHLMKSGAGHDAANFRDKGRLIFVPGRISHNPREYATPEAFLNAYLMQYHALNQAIRRK
ncbi:M20/M25/M40 family metallo-hydrolase, partial [Candidatus Woesearchaeota archaeon]